MKSIHESDTDYTFLPQSDKNPNITALYVNRQCGKVGPGMLDTCAYFKKQAKDISCYSCLTDLCNGSSFLSLRHLIVLPIVVLIAISFLAKILFK